MRGRLGNHRSVYDVSGS